MCWSVFGQMRPWMCVLCVHVPYSCVFMFMHMQHVCVLSSMGEHTGTSSQLSCVHFPGIPAYVLAHYCAPACLPPESYIPAHACLTLTLSSELRRGEGPYLVQSIELEGLSWAWRGPGHVQLPTGHSLCSDRGKEGHTFPTHTPSSLGPRSWCPSIPAWGVVQHPAPPSPISQPRGSVQHPAPPNPSLRESIQYLASP